MLLVLSCVAGFVLAVNVWRDVRTGRMYGAYPWFALMFLVTVLPGFIANYLEQGRPAEGPAEVALRVVTLSATFFALAGIWSQASTRPTGGPGVTLRWDSRPQRFWVFALTILGPSWLYFALLGYIPLLSAGLDFGSLQEARIARDPYHNANQAKIPLAGLLETFRNIGVPALAAAAWLRWRKHKKSSYFFVFVFCVFTVLGAGQRWPLQYLLLTTLIALLATAPTSVAGRKIIVRVAVIGAALGALVTVFQGRTGVEGSATFGEQFKGGLSALVDRISSGYVEVPLQSYSVLDALGFPLMGGSYLQTLMAFGPGMGESYAVTFYNQVLRIDSGFTASPDFSTELFINFGWVGVIAGSILWAFALRGLDARIFRSASMPPEELALIAMVVLSLSATTTEGLVGASARTLFILVPAYLMLKAYDGLQGAGSARLKSPVRR